MIHLVPFLLGVIAMASVTAAVFFLKSSPSPFFSSLIPPVALLCFSSLIPTKVARSSTWLSLRPALHPRRHPEKGTTAPALESVFAQSAQFAEPNRPSFASLSLVLM
jgi:hypothetical protein